MNGVNMQKGVMQYYLWLMHLMYVLNKFIIIVKKDCLGISKKELH